MYHAPVALNPRVEIVRDAVIIISPVVTITQMLAERSLSLIAISPISRVTVAAVGIQNYYI